MKHIIIIEWLNGRNEAILLYENEAREYSEGGTTEEGYSYTTTSYLYDGEKITRRTFNESRDCDGYTSFDIEDFTLVSELSSDSLKPKWTRVDAEYHDQFAEDMGY